MDYEVKGPWVQKPPGPPNPWMVGAQTYSTLVHLSQGPSISRLDILDTFFPKTLDIHSFVFINHFILVRVEVDQELITRTMGRSWEYTLDGTSVHPKAPCTHTFTRLFTTRGNVREPRENNMGIDRTST